MADSIDCDLNCVRMCNLPSLLDGIEYCWQAACGLSHIIAQRFLFGKISQYTFSYLILSSGSFILHLSYKYGSQKQGND